MVQIPHIVGHAAILNPNQAPRCSYTGPPPLPPSLHQRWESYNHVSREEQNKTAYAAVTELALSKTANAMRQGEWESLCGLSLFCSALPSSPSAFSSVHQHSHEWKEAQIIMVNLMNHHYFSSEEKVNSADGQIWFAV